MAAPKGHPRYGGRAVGTPNKVTKDVRQAMAFCLQEASPMFVHWLQQVAEGIPTTIAPMVDRAGNTILDENGHARVVTRWLRPPDPYRALNLVVALAEYHIPKLSRMELDAAQTTRIIHERRYFTIPPPPT